LQASKLQLQVTNQPVFHNNYTAAAEELLKSNAQTSNDTKQGQKEESLTEVRRADLINREV